MNASIEVELTGLVYGGDAIGRLPDGRAVFVPFGLPGEVVQVNLTEEKPHFARGEIVSILKFSSARIPPRCQHFGACGGCHYQHMSYPDQLAVKRDILIDQLARIANLTDVPVAEVVPSPQEWYYRNQVQFHLDAAGRLGFQAARSKDVVAIQECFLPEPDLVETWPQMQFEADLEIDRIGLRRGTGNDVLLLLESGTADIPEMEVEGLPISIVHTNQLGGCVVLAGSEQIQFEIMGVSFLVSARSFFQVNTLMAEAMVCHILANVRFEPWMQVLDLYCGVGLFSAFIAPKVGHLIGVESSPSACNDYAVNLDPYEHIELYQAEVEMVLPAIKLHPDIVIVDPPRQGLGKKALQQIVSLAPAQLVYVSCDPATFCRDARFLVQAGYRPGSVTPFDLFPQTYHVESISIFNKEA